MPLHLATAKHFLLLRCSTSIPLLPSRAGRGVNQNPQIPRFLKLKAAELESNSALPGLQLVAGVNREVVTGRLIHPAAGEMQVEKQ